ncbi:hypothetical protein CYMTET_26709, partial [Cymbomonas tetramitiformis]
MAPALFASGSFKASAREAARVILGVLLFVFVAQKLLVGMSLSGHASSKAPTFQLLGLPLLFDDVPVSQETLKAHLCLTSTFPCEEKRIQAKKSLSQAAVRLTMQNIRIVLAKVLLPKESVSKKWQSCVVMDSALSATQNQELIDSVQQADLVIQVLDDKELQSSSSRPAWADHVRGNATHLLVASDERIRSCALSADGCSSCIGLGGTLAARAVGFVTFAVFTKCLNPPVIAGSTTPHARRSASRCRKYDSSCQVAPETPAQRFTSRCRQYD